MRALFAVLPGQGHLLPMLPLARALAGAGHDVSFATSALYASQVERQGFRSVPAGDAWTVDEGSRYFPDLAVLTGEERTRHVYRTVFAGPPAARFAADVVVLGRRSPFDLVVYDSANYGAAAAAEALGIPHAAVGVSSVSCDRRWLAQFPESFAALRSACGLPPDPDLLMPHRHLLLSPVPRVLHGQALLPESYREARMESYEPAPGESVPDVVASLPGRPIVYVTFGTVHNKRPGVFRNVLGALAGEDVNVVATTGRDQDPAVLEPVPGNAVVERFIPQNALLPRCSAVVSHGGSGTLRAALWFGLPLLLMPFTADQPRNAAICQELGVAIALEPSAEAPAIRAAIRTLLDSSGHAERARAIGSRMRAMPGIEEAVRLVERLVSST